MDGVDFFVCDVEIISSGGDIKIVDMGAADVRFVITSVNIFISGVRIIINYRISQMEKKRLGWRADSWDMCKSSSLNSARLNDFTMANCRKKGHGSVNWRLSSCGKAKLRLLESFLAAL
jgi:hypothetical protein